MKKTLLLLPVLAALALTGCSADNQSADAKPSATAASGAPTTASATPSATTESVAQTPHKPKDTGIKFAGASDELKDLAIQEYADWDEYNEKDSHRFRGAYKAGHVVMLPANDPGLEGEFIKILEWNAPAENEIVVRIEGNSWSKNDLRVPGDSVSCALLDPNGENYFATFTTANGKVSATRECRNMPPEANS
ncbi:hypothetical protein ACTXOJ_15220 [Glutamicibacter arilaitensis]|uniref:hypothetical protein n=1 Tax=Glutamicibacter arilaitensis TaxID=256701 RepID=UPI003FD5150E